jgi:uncharacterized protein
MIPEFPKFKRIELSDKKDVEKFTSKFPPYADFSFSNIWIWNLKENMGLSILNDNLVVKFTDYLDGQLFFSFLGENMVNETARELIIFSKKRYKTNILRLVPEIATNFLDKSEFDVIPDANSHDYVYSVSHLANMNAWTKNSLSKGIRRFIKKNPDYIVKQHSIQEVSEDEYLRMFKSWSDNKNIKDHFELNEYKALKRMFQIKDKNIKIISLYLDDVLIGFTVFEIFSDDYAVSHFAKADISQHSSVYAVLNWEEAKILKKRGIKYYNWEQDLGIEGLKKSKMKYKPTLFLNKFFVKKHE